MKLYIAAQRWHDLSIKAGVRYGIAAFGFGLLAALLTTCMCEKIEESTFEPDAHVWDTQRFPLAVTSADDLNRDDIAAAVKMWNRGRCQLLRHVGQGVTGDLVVRIGSDVRQDAAGGWQMRYVTATGKWHGDALIRQPGDRRVIVITGAHELGHLLGLAHDDTMSMSVMHPSAASRQVGYVNSTDTDLRALARRYCR